MKNINITKCESMPWLTRVSAGHHEGTKYWIAGWSQPARKADMVNRWTGVLTAVR
jgi:hypothetical protein